MILERTPAAPRSASVIFQCGLAVVLVAAALTATFLLQSVVSTAGFIFFYTAVVASAWFGGKWSGLLAMLLSTEAIEYFFMAPLYSFGVNRESLPILIEFAVSALVVGLVQFLAQTSGGRAQLRPR